MLFGLPWDAQRILAGFGIEYFASFLLSSVDGGASFSQQVRLAKSAGSLGACVCGFAALTATHTLLATSLSDISRSTDGGHTWQLVTSAPLKGLIIWLLQAAPDGQTVYAGTDKSDTSGDSGDGGPAAHEPESAGGKPASDPPAPRHVLSWPVALRHVQSWLDPWVMLRRYWRTWSLAPPPPPLLFQP